MRNLQTTIAIIFFALTFATYTNAQCPSGYTSVGTNLSFEFPVMGCNSPSYIIIDDQYLPGWRSNAQGGNARTCNNEDNYAYTTDGENNVELWMSGFQGIDAVEGNQFMELNAHTGGTFSQDISLDNDCYDVFWSVHHRGRTGVDSMRIYIYAGATTYVDQIVGTGKTAWEQYQGVFTTEDVTTEIKIEFTTISTHNGNNSTGNFIDDVKFCVSALGCAQLPVELVDFTAENKENQVALNWITASELDNAGFEVERSQNGQTWETLDFVKGNGTTTNYNTYNYTDNTPLNGTSYYRLKQIDTNGTFEYSNVRSVTRSVSAEMQLNAYPNPTTGTLNLNTTEGANTITLMDSFGKTLKAWTINAEKNNQQISIEDFPAGIYMLSVQYNDSVQTQKIVKK